MAPDNFVLLSQRSKLDKCHWCCVCPGKLCNCQKLFQRLYNVSLTPRHMEIILGWCFQINVDQTALTSDGFHKVFLTRCSVSEWDEREVLSARLLLTDWLLTLVLCPVSPWPRPLCQGWRDSTLSSSGGCHQRALYWPDWRHPVSATLSSLTLTSLTDCVIIEPHQYQHAAKMQSIYTETLDTAGKTDVARQEYGDRWRRIV